MTPWDVAFMQRCVKRHYFERFDMIELPPDISRREFGYTMPGAGAMVRHLQMRGPADLRVLLLREAPLDVYVSGARYMLPDMPMRDKVWQGADLIFDIDAKDLGLECRPSHTAAVCGRCGRADAGAAGSCGRCGSGDVAGVSVACPKCVGAAGNHAARLLRILADDFGVEGAVYFSGNDGFHVHVHDGQLARLGRAGRADVADYMSLRGVMPERLADRDGKRSLPRRSERGWRGRFAGALSKSDRASIIREAASDVYSTRARALEDIVGNLGVRVDPGVTMDVHRIFRMPGTINGKSGMAKTKCADPKKFDPYESAVVMSDEPVHVRASCPVPFRMMRKKFGPYANEYVEVPSYAAAYMVCRGLAHVVG